MSNKVIFYKNSNRTADEENGEKYIPQYQSLGIEPLEYKSAIIPQESAMLAKPSMENPRLPRQVMIRQPYGEKSTSPVGNGNLPNVGNNIEQTWVDVDREIIDDLNKPMIDNNDFIDGDVSEHFEDAKASLEDALAPLHLLEENDLILFINDIPICYGGLSEVQDQARLLVNGTHELCDGTPVPIDEILILKKVTIKNGLFLES